MRNFIKFRVVFFSICMLVWTKGVFTERVTICGWEGRWVGLTTDVRCLAGSTCSEVGCGEASLSLVVGEATGALCCLCSSAAVLVSPSTSSILLTWVLAGGRGLLICCMHFHYLHVCYWYVATDTIPKSVTPISITGFLSHLKNVSGRKSKFLLISSSVVVYSLHSHGGH